MGGPPKPWGPASPVNMSKRGLSARLYASDQTPVRVKTRLPKRNLAGERQARPAACAGEKARFFRDMGQRSRGATHPGLGFEVLAFCKSRAQGKPGASCTRSLACNEKSTRVNHHRFNRSSPAFPAQWF